MIWIPLASIVIFVLLFIPSILLGIKRGWKSALFVSLTFLALNAAVIGIGFAIYHHGLWTLYKTMFMKKEMRINAIDYNLLADSYRPRVLLIFSAILSPLTYAITFGIYMLLRKPLNSYLMPKVKEISTNEKELLFRRKPTTSQVIGGVISTTTALFAASYFASAVNVLVTPRENQNGFNKVNDAIGRIYSFGMAGNTEDIKAMSQFLRQVDGDFVTSVQDLVAYDKTKQVFSKTDDANKAVAAQVAKYAFLFESPDAAKIIFDSLVSKINVNGIDVLDLAYDYKDAQGNDIFDINHNIAGVAQQARKMENLINFVNAKNILDSRLPLIARQALFERLVKAIAEFSVSVYATQFADWQSTQVTAQNVIKARQEDLKTQNEKLKELIKGQNDAVDIIERNTGVIHKMDTTLDAEGHNHNNIKFFDILPIDITRTSDKLASNSAIKTEYALEVTYKSNVDAQEKEKDRYFRIWDDNHKNVFIPLDNERLTKERENALQQGKVSTAEGALTHAQNVLTTAKSNEANYKTQLDVINNRISALPHLISTALSAKDAAQRQVDSADAAYGNAKQNYDSWITKQATTQNDFNTATTQKELANSEMKTKNELLERAKARLNGVSKTDSNYQMLLNGVAVAEANYLAAKSFFDIKVKAESDAKTENENAIKSMNQAKSSLDEALRKLNEANNLLARKTQDWTQLKTEQTSKEAEQENVRRLLNAANADVRASQTNVDELLAKLEKEKNILHTMLTEFNEFLKTKFNPQKQIDASNEAKKNEENNKWIILQKIYSDQQQKVDGLIEQTITALKSIHDSNVKEPNGFNDEIKATNDHIDILTKTRSHTFIESIDHAVWDFAEHDKNNLAYEDQSIYAAQQYLAFVNLKIQQTLIIKNNMELEYNKLLIELKEAFKTYTKVA